MALSQELGCPFHCPSEKLLALLLGIGSEVQTVGPLLSLHFQAVC